MKKEELLFAKLMEYQKSDRIPFHMPGHKRCTEDEMLKEFPNPYSIDITEIEGFDNLHYPEGILKKSMEWAADVYHAEHTYYLINGSSSGVLSAICAATCPGGKILMSRNCHKSAYHGVILNRLQPEYIYPQILDGLGIQGGIMPSDVENMLSNGELPQAVLLVSPTYDGIVSDIEAIAEIVHGYGLPLIVDEAHGAHFSFGGDAFPKSALECGADIVIQSLHKTLPSFTQTAVLHVQGNRVDTERLERHLQMFQSSSPSYVLMAGIERCIYEMEQQGSCHMSAFSKRLKQAREKLGQMKHLKLLQNDCVGNASIFDIDASKLVVSCRGCVMAAQDERTGDIPVTGEHLNTWLRDKYNLEMEMCGADYVVAITTYLDDEVRLNKLADALMELDSSMAIGAQSAQAESWSKCVPDICLNPADGADAAYDKLPLEECAGKISTEFVYLYPPGIPVVAPGELVTEEIIRQIQYYKEIGLPIQGLADRNAENLQVMV